MAYRSFIHQFLRPIASARVVASLAVLFSLQLASSGPALACCVPPRDSPPDPLPDLAVSATRAIQSTPDGVVYVDTLSIKNVGPGDVPNRPGAIWLHYSTNWMYNDGRATLGPVFNDVADHGLQCGYNWDPSTSDPAVVSCRMSQLGPGLVAGDTAKVTFSALAPVPMNCGAWTARVVVDPLNVFVETTRANNSASVVTQIGCVP